MIDDWEKGHSVHVDVHLYLMRPVPPTAVQVTFTVEAALYSLGPGMNPGGGV